MSNFNCAKIELKCVPCSIPSLISHKFSLVLIEVSSAAAVGTHEWRAIPRAALPDDNILCLSELLSRISAAHGEADTTPVHSQKLIFIFGSRVRHQKARFKSRQQLLSWRHCQIKGPVQD